ncbi:MAG TPA: BatD family protein, partial [Candidatus Polarisedimenticolia bacterium]|nr:BatD family protein [Candidatus Polarisedimenticolia bacterium]
MGRLAAAALLLGLAPGPGSAHAREDGITVEARVDAERIGEGDSLTLTVEVRGAAPGQIEDPDLSGLADFSIAAGPSLSTSTSMIWQGGQATTSTSRQFSYVLLPRRRGSLTIPSISIRLGSKIRQTNPITIEVVEGRVRRPGPGGRRGAPAPGGRGASLEPAAGELLVESATDKREVFVGE